MIKWKTFRTVGPCNAQGNRKHLRPQLACSVSKVMTVQLEQDRTKLACLEVMPGDINGVTDRSVTLTCACVTRRRKQKVNSCVAAAAAALGLRVLQIQSFFNFLLWLCYSAVTSITHPELMQTSCCVIETALALLLICPFMTRRWCLIPAQVNPRKSK